MDTNAENTAMPIPAEHEQEHEQPEAREQNQGHKHGYSPAYTSFATLKAFVATIDPRAIPRTLDRSMMRNLSGGAKRKLWAGMIFLRLISGSGEVQEPLRQLVLNRDSEADYKAALAEIVNVAYAPILKDMDIGTATAKQLEDAFRNAGAEGATRTEAIRFFLHARKEAGLPISPYISGRPQAAASNGNGTGRTGAAPRAPRRNADRKPSPKPAAPPPATPPPGTRPEVAAGLIRLPLYLPGKPVGTIDVPEDLVEADVQMITAMLTAYATRRAAEKDQ